MDARLTIGQLARAAGVPTTTVRYYERRGLLGPAPRTGPGRYRTYGAADLDRLRFIRAAQATGFTLEDIGTLLALRDGVRAPCAEVQSLIEARLADVARRAQDLRRVSRVLRSALATCRTYAREGRCEVIEELATAAHAPPARSR